MDFNINQQQSESIHLQYAKDVQNCTYTRATETSITKGNINRWARPENYEVLLRKNFKICK